MSARLSGGSRSIAAQTISVIYTPETAGQVALAKPIIFARKIRSEKKVQITTQYSNESSLRHKTFLGKFHDTKFSEAFLNFLFQKENGALFDLSP